MHCKPNSATAVVVCHGIDGIEENGEEKRCVDVKALGTAAVDWEIQLKDKV